MKKIICIAGLVLLLGFAKQTSVYDFNITTREGNELSLKAFEGKKLMIIVLPASTSASDSALLQQLATLHNAYKDSVAMIGISSYEDGFENEDASYLLEFYQTYLDESFVIAGGMYTRKVSDQQSPLFRYLTYASQNGYFDEDVSGVGEKFFINAEGVFTGISAAGSEFNEDIFLNMISR